MAVAIVAGGPVDFQIAIDISAPVEVVWAVMVDVERWPEWTASVRKVRRLGHGPLTVGQRALILQPKLPPAVWTVTAIQAGRSFTWTSGAPGMRVIGHHAVEGGATGARATLSLKFKGLFGGLLARMTSGITRRYLSLEAEGLKRRSEGLGAHETR
jgi:Polyketide cyclase / dehydrase and lipid transport